MKTLGVLLVLTLLTTACGAPPSRPESLWDSLPPSGEGSAKSVPAQAWNGAETAGNAEGEGSAAEAAGSEPVVEAEEIVGTVVLNEIFYDAVGSDTDGLLFVELYGTPGLLIGGFRVLFVDGGDGSIDDTIVLPEGERIPGDGYYVVADARTGSPDISQVPNPDLIDNFDPQNGPDAVLLTDTDGALLDAVGYGDGVVAMAENGLPAFEGQCAPDVVNGHSLERKEPGIDTGDNFSDFMESESPTPGAGPVTPIE
ncbi:MAG TPA: lamin tail domain-containing protein [bacterium]|nr:lamin tail domain-containing protein [bacterium]